MTTVKDDVRRFIQQDLRRDVGGVGDGDSLLEAGVIDSLAMLRLVTFLEASYGVQVADDDLMPEHFDSLDAIAAYVASHAARS